MYEYGTFIQSQSVHTVRYDTHYSRLIGIRQFCFWWIV